MKLEERDNLKILISSTGYLSTLDRQAVYESPIYLGIYDSESNYIEITESEKQAILESLELKRLEEEKLANEQGGVENGRKDFN